MFLGMRYSAASINGEEIRVSFSMNENKKIKTYVRAPKEKPNSIIMDGDVMAKYNWKCLNKK